jgi:hypothetical protein
MPTTEAIDFQTWLQAGDTPSRLNPAFKMSPESTIFFDEGVGRCGAVISGRRNVRRVRCLGWQGPVRRSRRHDSAAMRSGYRR